MAAPDSILSDEIAHHEIWMARALNLAERALGSVAPNPAVGCIIVKDGELLGKGYTQKGGRPHAETQALMRAGAGAEGADIYITLEPCAHEGETPPCVDALIAAKPERVICALSDPDSRVSGKGIEKLRAHNIEVIENVLQEEASFLNQGYLLHRTQIRPLITLKTGSTLDGRISTLTGNSRWITNKQARAQTHSLRSSYDAVIIGSRTSLGDNPELTCRLNGLENRTPIRVVADSHLSIPLTSKLVNSAQDYPLWIMCREDSDPVRRKALEESGAKLFNTAVEEKTGMLSTRDIVSILAEQGITRLLIEGGAHLSASFLRAGLIDRIYWFSAPKIIGADGTATFSAMGFERLADAPSFAPLWRQNLGDNSLTLMERS